MIQSGLIPWGHWRWMIPVDTLTGVMVIAVCIGILAANVGTVIDKAQMSGVWFQTQPARIAVSEALALTGDIDASIPAGSTPDTVGGRWQVDDRGDVRSRYAGRGLVHDGEHLVFANDAMLRELVTWYQQGKIKPAIDRTMPMSELKAAYARMSSRQVMGKLVMVNP